MKLIEHYVGGKLISGTSDKRGKVFNPATGEQVSEVSAASERMGERWQRHLAFFVEEISFVHASIHNEFT